MKVVVKKKDNAIPVAITTEYIKLQDAMKQYDICLRCCHRFECI